MCGHISNQIVFYLEFYNMLHLLGLEKVVILHSVGSLCTTSIKITLHAVHMTAFQ